MQFYQTQKRIVLRCWYLSNRTREDQIFSLVKFIKESDKKFFIFCFATSLWCLFRYAKLRKERDKLLQGNPFLIQDIFLYLSKSSLLRM